jgi:curved DNA-binding protein CbpA
VTRGDPFLLLGLTPDSSPAAVRAAWRRLARRHHPDLAADPKAARDATRKMAEINTAYEAALRIAEARRPGRAHRDPAVDAHPRRARERGPDGSTDPEPGAAPGAEPGAQPSPRPVTLRVDTSSIYRARGASGGGRPGALLSGQEPRRAHRPDREELRASDPNGPLRVERPRRRRRVVLPDLETARGIEVPFGKFHGRTLGEVERAEPSYIDWLVRTYRRDPGLVAAARAVQAELDRAGIDRPHRAPGAPVPESILAD